METDQETHIEGIAQNGKAGAILLMDSIGPVYLEGLLSFPDADLGKNIEAWGQLQEIQHKAENLQNEKGEWSQGMSGSQLLLKNPRWKVKE